jgi:L-lactate dehydrogenase complex protein LldG
MSDDARAEILAAVRSALGPPPRRSSNPPSPPLIRSGEPAEPHALVDLFSERAQDYAATVTSTEREVADAVASAAKRNGARRLVTAPGLLAQWRPAELELIDDDAGLTARELEQFDGALTSAALAIAETGTIVLDHAPDQGRRAVTLLPDLHICVVAASRTVADLQHAIAVLEERVRSGSRPITLVSGPSATSDIELRRVEGVHGPRRLEIILARRW